MAANWQEIAMVDYAFKIIICALFFLPLYGVLLNYILKKMATDHKDQNHLNMV